MVEVIRSTFREHGLQHRIGEDLRVEQLLEAVQRLLSAGVLVETRHALTSFLRVSLHHVYWCAAPSAGLST